MKDASFQIVHFCASPIFENRCLQGQSKQAEWESPKGSSSPGQAEQRLYPQPFLHLHHSSFSAGIAPQCPYLPRPGGPSLHNMPRHSLHFPTVPPAPLPAQLVVWLPLHTAHTCPPCPPGPFPKPQLIPSTLVPAGHQSTARLVLSVPCSPFPSHLVQAVSMITCTLHLHRKDRGAARWIFPVHGNQPGLDTEWQHP